MRSCLRTDEDYYNAPLVAHRDQRRWLGGLARNALHVYVKKSENHNSLCVRIHRTCITLVTTEILTLVCPFPLFTPCCAFESLSLRLDVDIEALKLVLVLDSTKCRCLDVLGIGIGNHLQCQEVLATTAPSHPQYRACTLRTGRNWR